jgi:hypothetical protein
MKPIQQWIKYTMLRIRDVIDMMSAREANACTAWMIAESIKINK